MSANAITNNNETGYFTARPLTSYITTDNAIKVTKRVAKGWILSKAISLGVNHFFPQLMGIGIATDIITNVVGGRSYDPSTCVGTYNICYDSCVPGCWGDSTACVVGCHLAYMACKKFKGI